MIALSRDVQKEIYYKLIGNLSTVLCHQDQIKIGRGVCFFGLVILSFHNFLSL